MSQDTKLWAMPPKPHQPEESGDETALTAETPPSLLFPADRVYVPYDTRTRPETLILLTAILPAQGAAYHQLRNYSFDQHYGQFLTLFYPSMRVDIKGQRLAPVIHAVISFKCAIIREWHRDFYDPPTRGIAVIESVTITPMGAEP
ncbi:MAG: hypothetical protein M3N08_09780 [Pseudomonadota bacterium]|nr:hypothetical protein [Pseudomonadota bacterium]